MALGSCVENAQILFTIVRVMFALSINLVLLALIAMGFVLRSHINLKSSGVSNCDALQSHSTQQQVLLHQLRNRLQEYESEQDTEAMSKAHAIEDLHSRLKNNVETIQQLNQQLNTLNKENLRQRHIIDREAAARKGLQLQLESRDQTIMALKAQVESYKFAEVPHRDTDNIMDAYGLNDSAYSSLDKGLQKSAQKDKLRSLMKKEMDKAGVKDPQVLDKSYWIQRVGELSIQLQQSSEYWAQKVRDLTTQLDNQET